VTDLTVYQEQVTVPGSGDGNISVLQESVVVPGSGLGNVLVQQEVVYTVGIAPSEFIRVYDEPVYVLAAAATADLKIRDYENFIYLLHGELPATRRLRAWTFSMDGHDFYVLMLGKDGTLVYDVTTGQFYTWQSNEFAVWRAGFGLNWENDIIAGDFVEGKVYNIVAGLKKDFGTETIISYITGFIGHRGRDPLPNYGVTLITSQGDPVDANSGVELRISDDLEQTWWSAGRLVMPEIGALDYDLSWYSLGQIQQPGRIFQLIDYGYADRVDALEFLEGPKGG
jgi:hypothetical protein